MEPVEITLKLKGMHCVNCARNIESALHNFGLSDASVDFVSSEAQFSIKNQDEIPSIISKIQSIGYKASLHGNSTDKSPRFSTLEKLFALCVPLSALLMLHMLIPLHVLHEPWVQFAICLPVFLIGLVYFGRSAAFSLVGGIPNMDVLIVIGILASFIYSFTGTVLGLGPDFLFYETTATITTIVLFGNILEDRAVRKTSSAIEELARLQPKNAKKIIDENGREIIEEIPATSIQIGDLILINSGDHIPADGEVIWGMASVNESMVSGESLPIGKTIGAKVIGGTVLVRGNIKVRTTAVGEHSVLSNIIKLVRDAQKSKPKIQRIGDIVSAYFVPAVLLIAIGAFLVSYHFLGVPFQVSLLRAIAVLVIACPCAMGLATPTAIMVGLGRAAKQGILIKGADTAEAFSEVKTVIFDKTGTLTTGSFSIKQINAIQEVSVQPLSVEAMILLEDQAIACRTRFFESCDDLANENYWPAKSYPYGGGLNASFRNRERLLQESNSAIKSIIAGLERFSSHRIANSLLEHMTDVDALELHDISETRGLGIKGTDNNGNVFEIGSYRLNPDEKDHVNHDLYLLKNGQLIATIDLQDEIKAEAKDVLEGLHNLHIHTVLLSGDEERKCKDISEELGIDEIYFEKSPEEKLRLVQEMSLRKITAFVGDGINDAPSLSAATVGVSLSDATESAIQSAQVLLLHGRLDYLVSAIRISRLTYRTIKQNLFWAFSYNIVAIPLAAAGYLNPMIAALAMAFSDVVVIGNSLRLRRREL